MNTVDRATFIENGRAVVALVSNRIETYDLSGADDTDLAPTPRWGAKMSHCVDVVEAPVAGVVICTDTSGRHLALAIDTGAVLWQTKAVGEGDCGLVIADPTGQAATGEAFVYASWKGMLQILDPTTGAVLDRPEQFDPAQFSVRQLHRDTSGQLSVVLGHRGPEGWVVHNSLCRLDPISWNTTEIMPLNDVDTARLAPDGSKLLAVELVVPCPGERTRNFERWTVRSVGNRRVLATRDMLPGQFSRLASGWGPRGNHIWTKREESVLLLDPMTLETKTEVPINRYRQPAFHPAGQHVLTCTGRKTRVMPLGAVLP